MSRIVIDNGITIDLVTGYSPEIPSKLSLFFPGNSSLIEFLSKENPVSENEVFSYYKITTYVRDKEENSETVLIKSLDQYLLKESGSFFTGLFQTFLSQNTDNHFLVIGVLFYPKNEYEKIEDCLQYLVYILKEIPREKPLNITIALANEFLKKLSIKLRNEFEGENVTYCINKEMRLDLYDKITCKQCKELPTVGHVSLCCQSMYCEHCVRFVKTCFDCRIDVMRTEIDPFFTAFIRDMNYKCRCNNSFKCGDIKAHAFVCELSVFRCKALDCKFEGTQAELVAHFIEYHFNEIGSGDLFNSHRADFKKECPKCGRYSEQLCASCPRPVSFEEVLGSLGLRE